MLFKPGLDHGEEEECSICLEEFTGGATLPKLPCGHLYHQHCIKEWFCGHNFCPLCKFVLTGLGPDGGVAPAAEGRGTTLPGQSTAETSQPNSPSIAAHSSVPATHDRMPLQLSSAPHSLMSITVEARNSSEPSVPSVDTEPGPSPQRPGTHHPAPRSLGTAYHASLSANQGKTSSSSSTRQSNLEIQNANEAHPSSTLLPGLAAAPLMKLQQLGSGSGDNGFGELHTDLQTCSRVSCRSTAVSSVAPCPAFTHAVAASTSVSCDTAAHRTTALPEQVTRPPCCRHGGRTAIEAPLVPGR